jgi:subfamily B ATP-binding cassette protein MsbA
MNTYRRLLTYVRPYRNRFILSIACGLLVSATTTLSALLVKPILDDIFVARDTGKLYFFPLLIIALYATRGLLHYGHAYLMRYIGQGVIRDIRNQLFAHLLHMPLAYFHRHHTGTLMSRLTNDITFMQRAVSSSVNDVLRQGLTMLGLIGVAFYRDWFLATFAVLILPLASIPIVFLGRKLRRLNRRAQAQMGVLSTLLKEVLSGIKVVKAFGRESYEQQRFQQRNAAFYNVTMRAVKTDEIGSPIMEMLAALGVALVVFYGGRQVVHGASTPGTFFSFLTAVLWLYEPMRKLSNLNSTLQGGLAAADRVFDVLDQRHDPPTSDGQTELPPLRHRLLIRNVSMRYTPHTPFVLQNVNLQVEAGEVVALVGFSGAGKTSLVDLLPRFYDPQQGAILIDDVDIRQVSLASLRAQIGVVSQDIVLFDDTLRQNILYGNPQATEAQMIQAARAAYAHDFISRTPLGYDTVIGERGVRLSGGEKQRLAIARALLKNSPILILDEATSALDSESEQMVQYALDNLMKDRTTFVIAHRLSTVRHADKIVVLHQGKVVETGRHGELLVQGGLYSRLYDLQFKRQETD